MTSGERPAQILGVINVVHRLILSHWAEKQGIMPKVLEGEFSIEEIQEYNILGYNCYFLPNEPNKYERGTTVDGRHIDIFRFCFVDMDLKMGGYDDKQVFISLLKDAAIIPTAIVDSGNGVHAYWEVSGLDAMTFLKLQRRLCRTFNTDPAVAKIYQLMRVPETLNVKDENDFKLCQVLDSSGKVYEIDDLNQALPSITFQDEEYCKQHFNKTYQIDDGSVRIKEELPEKFQLLLTKNREIKRLFFGPVKDRSVADYRLAHLLYASDLTKDEVRSVLYNSAKAIERAPIHRYNYANDIAEKIYAEIKAPGTTSISSSILDILNQSDAGDGDRFRCSEFVDATVHGFRLGEVMGLVGGPGSGKTNKAFNMFKWFCERNPNYIHVFVNLEEQDKELANRWVRLVGQNDTMHGAVRIVTNYNKDGTCRNLSLDEVKTEISHIEKSTGKKVGCVVVDHIGALKQSDSGDGEFEGLIGICKEMKPFAVSTNTFLIMQSHSNRDKAGSHNDQELNLDAAYGTSQFERWVDYLVTTWQPLSRVYGDSNFKNDLYVQAYKFCKIRVMDPINDRLKRNQIYLLKFDPKSGGLDKLTEEDYKAFDFWDKRASNIRNRDRKEPTRAIQKITWV